MLALLRLAQIPDHGRAAVTSECCERGFGYRMSGDQGEPLSSSVRGRQNPDPRIERAQRHAVLLESFPVEGDRVCKGGVAQLSEPIKWKVPQVGNDGLKLLPLQGDHSPAKS
jgi:hypothetical protein